jgi:hypothetical protein
MPPPDRMSNLISLVLHDKTQHPECDPSDGDCEIHFGTGNHERFLPPEFLREHEDCRDAGFLSMKSCASNQESCNYSVERNILDQLLT